MMLLTAAANHCFIVLIFFISLCDIPGFLSPPPDAPISALPITHKGEVLIKFKNFFYFEHKDTPVAEAEQVRVHVCHLRGKCSLR